MVHNPSPPELESNALEDVKRLVDSAQEAFRLLEPWCGAKPESSHRLVNKMVGRLRKYAQEYLKAIDNSITLSDMGIIFSIHAKSLCRKLEAGYPYSEISLYIADMRKEMNRACRKAKKSVDSFTSVKVSFRHCKADIPTNIEKIEQEIESAHQAVLRDQRRAKSASNFAESLMNDFGIGMTVPLTGRLFDRSPHLAIILPIAIPFAILGVKSATRLVEKTALASASDPQQQIVAGEMAIDMLQEIERKLETVIKDDNHNKFVDWWETIDQDLTDIERMISSEPPGAVKACIGQIQSRLCYVETPFRAYAGEMRKLQDFYPATYRRRQ